MSYDDLHYAANTDKVIRQLIGVESELEFKNEKIGYQQIKDNVGLLTDDTVRELNQVILAFGHSQVFKKKEEEPLRLKTDSFVVESNVHFPTDYNLLWDAARKALDMIDKLCNKRDVSGWRKRADWREGTQKPDACSGPGKRIRWKRERRSHQGRCPKSPCKSRRASA